MSENKERSMPIKFFDFGTKKKEADEQDKKPAAENVPPIEPVPLPNISGTAEAPNPFIKAEESEEYKRLEKEFNEYKRKKVLSKIDGVLVEDFTLADVKAGLKSLASSARARAVVTPNLVSFAKRELPAVVKVEALINYPYASSTKKALICEIKAALQQRVEVCVCINTLQLEGNNRKPIEKLLRYIKKLSARAKITPAFSVGRMNTEQLGKLAYTVKANKFERVKLTVGGGEGGLSRTADAVKIFYDILGEQCLIEVIGKISSPADAEMLFNAGADRIVTTDYKTLSRQKLDNVTV